MKELINKTIAEVSKNFPELSEGEVRLMVYEDLRDGLKYLMTDVSY